MATFTDIGIPLKKSFVGEGDIFLDILTYKHGRIAAIARGASKLLSRKRGNIEIGSITNFHFAEGKTKHVVVEAEMENSIRNLRLTQEGIRLVWWLCKLSSYLFKNGGEEFEVLETTLKWIDKITRRVRERNGNNLSYIYRRVKIWFSLKALALTGFVVPTQEVLDITSGLEKGVLLLKTSKIYRQTDRLTRCILKDIMY